MNILVCVHNLAGGGAERVASLWLKMFVSLGHNVSVITCDRYVRNTYAIPSVVKQIDIGNYSKNRYLFALEQRTIFYYRLRRSVKECNPDVIITIMPSWIKLLRRSTWGIKYKLISTDHNSYERPINAAMPRHQYKAKFKYQHFADLITVLTNADKKFIGNKLKNVYVLPNPLTFEPIDKIHQKDKIVLAVGRLDAWYVKGFDVLIEAWSKIFIKYPEWKLCIMGHGSEESTKFLNDMAVKRGLGEQFELLPFTANPKPIYEKSEIFVLSSRFEGFGMVLIEAMSQGCACIACDYKGRQREIITDKQNGLICPTEAPNDLSKSISLIISDINLRKMLQKNAIKKSSDYGVEKIQSKWESLLSIINL
jgi:glycosyltransferase involved in cell wall biosynthesis